MSCSGEQMKAALLAKVRGSARPPEVSAPAELPLDPDELAVLMELISHPFVPASTAARNMATIGPRKFKRVADGLREKGFLEEVRLQLRAGRGRPTEFLWATNAGRRVIGQGDRGQEGFFHLYTKKVVLPAYLTGRDFKCSLEFVLSNGHPVDVVATKGVERHAYEVETGQSDVVENLRAIGSAEETFDSVTVVTMVRERHRIAARIERAFGERAPSAVRVASVAEFAK